MRIALEFDDRAALDPASSGGKGANLARLTQAGFPVPPGFIVTAEAYQLFAQDCVDLLQAAEGYAFGEPAQLDRQCEALQRELLSRPVPPFVATAIAERLRALGAGHAVSVRSSATTEDLGGAAFAGQHETYLNTRGPEEVIERIRQCWVSLWSARALAYRRANGFSVPAARMAVVVQRMAFCDVAGVGFSFNPITGNLREQVFDANRGLGESVVGGEGQIDHFIVDRTTGAILSAAIAEKRSMIVARGDGAGTKSVALDGEACSQPCLTAEELRRLSELLCAVERLYGFPQDIEWGLEQGALRLLQSRPITRIPPRWTRDESAERFPSVITPLAWALVEGGFHRSLNYSFALMGLPPFRGKWFASFGHYVYGNQNAVEIYANGAIPGLSVSSLAELAAAVPALRERYGWVLELPLTWSRDLDHYLIGIGELMAEPLEERSVAELWAFVLRVRDLGAEYFLPNIAISITQRALYRLLLGLLEATVGREQAPILFDRLLAYCETKTGTINKELHRFARRIAGAPELAARLEGSSGVEFLRAGGFQGHPDLEATFHRFLRDHGHREVEFDPYHATWIDAPDLVIENLKAMLHSSREDPATKERELKILMSETEEALLQQTPPELRYLVREISRLARVYTTLDDVEHYQTTRLTLPLRKGLGMLGKRLRVLGVVDAPADIFFANYTALADAIEADNPECWHQLRLQIAAEKAAYLQHRASSPPWDLGDASARPAGTASVPGSAEGSDANDSAVVSDASDTVLTGLPGSPGTASGPVFRVHGSEDFGRFPRGAVLVARTTNPAWTPLFFKASAVITECGGPLSHGAVTAREIGLPAVMSVRDALSRLEDGERLTVNGTTGRIHKAAVT